MGTAAFERAPSRSAGAGRVLRPVISARTWLAVAHLLTGLPLGMVTLLVLVVGVALGVGTLPVGLVGVPVLALVLGAVSGMCRLERARTAAMLGVVIGAPALAPLTGGAWWRLRARGLLDVRRWCQAGAVIVLFPCQVAGFFVAVFCWLTALELITLPAYNWSVPGGVDLGAGHVHGAAELVACVAAGVVVLLAAPWVTRGAAVALAAATRVLLGPGRSGVLVARIGELEHSRAVVVDAATDERRRIERDLHDGAQQRLVAMTIELARARAKFAAADPQAARVLVDHAHEQARAALAELRNLVRGVHPPVLSDRGLDAALSGLAVICQVPVTLDVDLTARPSATIESVAYFVVSEALTNVAKHARATRAEVTVRQAGHLLSIVISDDGAGGAAQRSGGGLAGLAGRVAAVDGRLKIDSPPGGPTIIAADLPCGS